MHLRRVVIRYSAMRKRLRWILFSAGCIALCILAWEIMRPHEPSYRGKELTECLKVAGWNALDRQGREAVLNIGTNAIPVLLQLLQTKDSPLKTQLAFLVTQQHLVNISLHSAEEKRLWAIEGFRALGTNGHVAVPALCDLYRKTISSQQPEHQFASALAALGSEARTAVPDLLRGLQTTNVPVRMVAMYALSEMRQEPDLVLPALMQAAEDGNMTIQRRAIAALSAFQTNGRPAISLLAKLATNAAPDIRAASFRALGTIGGEPAIIVPILTNGLADSADNAQEAAAVALGAFGTNIQPAVPLLIDLAKQGNRDAAVTTLIQIKLRPDCMVPVLMAAFRNSGGASRYQVARARGDFGTNALPAVPMLLEACKGETSPTPIEFARRYGLTVHGANGPIFDALCKIDPDAAAKARSN